MQMLGLFLIYLTLRKDWMICFYAFPIAKKLTPTSAEFLVYSSVEYM